MLARWQAIVRALMLFRVLRFLRLLGRVPRFRALMRTYMALVPILGRALLPMLFFYYFFALLAGAIYGGLLFPANPALIGSLYANSNYYYVATFNDLWSSFATLFQLMIVNNWFVIASGPEAATTEWSRLFFVVWWCISVLVGVNLFVALLLEAFTATQRKSSNSLYAEETHESLALGANANDSDEVLVASKALSIYDLAK